jgi:hypothetical protein
MSPGERVIIILLFGLLMQPIAWVLGYTHFFGLIP